MARKLKRSEHAAQETNPEEAEFLSFPPKVSANEAMQRKPPENDLTYIIFI